MTHQDGTDSVWECCGAWECVCGLVFRDAPGDFMFRDLPNSYACGPNGCRAYTAEERAS